jgi:hypothetical protein
MAATDPVVTLRGGLTVPLRAITLLLDLEARQFRVREAPDGALLVSPRSCLTPEDDRLIRRHRDELLALVRYRPEGVQ